LGARLATLLLGAAAMAFAPPESPAAGLLLGAAYLLWTTVGWWLPARVRGGSPAQIEPAVDAVAIGLLIALLPPDAPQVWPLYLFPRSAAAVAGPGVAVATLAIAIAGGLATPIAREELTPDDVWPLLFLSAAAVLASLLFARTRAEQQERRAT